MRGRTNRALLLSFGLHIGLLLAISPFLVSHFSAEKESISAEILKSESETQVRRRVLPPRAPLIPQVSEAEASTSSPASPTYAPDVSVPKAPVQADVVPDTVTHTDLPQSDVPSPVSNASAGEDSTLAGPVVIQGQRGTGVGGSGSGGYGTGTGRTGRKGNGIGERFSNLTEVSDISSTAFEKITYGFTFVRLKYLGSSWKVDWPDSDRNFIQQLQEHTTLDVAPAEKIIDIGSEELFRYPFVYVVEPSGLNLTYAEAKHLRKYLLGGGFIIVDDFHGQQQWQQFYAQFKRIFPEHEPEDIPLSHPLFHCFYNINELMQIPGAGAARRGRTYERGSTGGRHVRCLGIHDDNGRLMMMINFNSDLGDGWEHTADDFYPDKYSDMAFKMGVNAVIYALDSEHPVRQSEPRIPDALKKLKQRLDQIEKTK